MCPGSPIKPTELSNLDLSLVKGSEYVIDSYSDNVNAGNACVTVKGVNGCSGTAKMYFVIQPVNIGNAKVEASVRIIPNQSQNQATNIR